MRVADRPAPAVDGATGPRGLSLLVQQVLGKPLDKTQQLSNWDRRPLGEGQLVYAAADAYCLLEVFWALCREPARFHLPGALPWSLGLGRSKRRGTWEPPPQKASASPWQVARQEGRVILTSGLPYHKLRAQVGAGRCLAVDCSLKAQQQAKAILRHFNVRVTPADIFSRCQACNCDRYLKVSKDVMKQLVRLSVHLGGPGGSSTEGPHSDGEQEAGSAPEEAPGGCSYDPPCRWLEDADLQTRVPATLASGTQLQLAGVPAGVLRRPGLGHSCCCSGCGSLLGRLPPGPSHQQLPRGPGGRPPPSQRPLLRAGPGPPGVNMPTLHRWGPRAPSSGLRSPLPRARQPLAA